MTRNAGRRWTGGLCVGVLLALTACASRAPVVTEVPAPPTLSVAQVARLLPAKVKGAERE
ncbi:DUF1615 domain-containing protein, partial [Corallococcus exiguus]|nr:DUF1615 domain-containing protein [Corallococcus exiguus]